MKAGEYFDKGDYTNAITAYNEVISRNSYNLDAYWFRGVAYLRIGNYDECINDCNTVINGAPDFPTVYIIRGDAYGAKGIYHKVIVEYKKGLEKGYDPSNFNVDKSNNADMWFCGTMYMEIAVNRFLGNSDVITRYENWLNIVSDKNRVTRAEIEAFYRSDIRNLISHIVEEEFYKRSEDNVIPARVYALLMARGAAQGTDAMALIKDTLTGFFLDPTQTNYEKVRGIRARYIAAWDSMSSAANDALMSTIMALSQESLNRKLYIDVTNDNARALARIPSDPRFDIFSARYY